VLIISSILYDAMELIESLKLVALGFGPTLAALIGISKAGLLESRKIPRKIQAGYHSFLIVKKEEAE